jgi:8-oxo-dGTP diphosphatase
VEIGETVEEAAIRVAREEPGLVIKLLGLVGVYAAPARDRRGHVVSVGFLARGSGRLQSGSDARSAEVFPPEELTRLSFDHEQIISDALHLAEVLGNSNENG